MNYYLLQFFSEFQSAQSENVWKTDITDKMMIKKRSLTAMGLLFESTVNCHEDIGKIPR